MEFGTGPSIALAAERSGPGGHSQWGDVCQRLGRRQCHEQLSQFLATRLLVQVLAGMHPQAAEVAVIGKPGAAYQLAHARFNQWQTDQQPQH